MFLSIASSENGDCFSIMLTSSAALTKNGMRFLAAPPKPDLGRYKTDNKIRDEEILKILERPLARSTGSKGKNKKKKKKPAKKSATDGSAPEEESSEEED